MHLFRDFNFKNFRFFIYKVWMEIRKYFSQIITLFKIILQLNLLWLFLNAEIINDVKNKAFVQIKDNKICYRIADTRSDGRPSFWLSTLDLSWSTCGFTPDPGSSTAKRDRPTKTTSQSFSMSSIFNVV